MFRWVLAVSTFAFGCALGEDGVRPRDGDGGPRRDGGRGDAGIEDCIEGSEVECATECGSIGTAICMSRRPGPCTSPEEECDGADQDCDGAIDESIEDRTCTVACGGGMSRCEGGRFTMCKGGTPSAETCDGTDEDCDGAIDDELTRGCTAACGPGAQTCDEGVWGGCVGPAPRTETCDGTDEDCDGAIDDNVSRDCGTACGTGRETCTAPGTFTGCTAPAPLVETCNRGDDDCDGTTDEGFNATIFEAVPMAELTAEQPLCEGMNGRIDVCMTACKRWCHNHASGCYRTGGAGFLQATPTTARVVCFTDVGDEHNVAFTTVTDAAGFTVDIGNVSTRAAQSGTHRYCRSRGFETGVGPTEYSSTEMTVTCLPDSVAEAIDVTTAELIALGCSPVTDANLLVCSIAADNHCRGLGYRSGYGPVEWNDETSVVVCFESG